MDSEPEISYSYGIVELHKQNNALVSEVKATQFKGEFGLDAA